MSHRLRAALADLPSADADAIAAMQTRSANVLRPPGALASLDRIATHIAGWQRTDTPGIHSPAVIVFAGDHGVADAGVSNFPVGITAAMLSAVHQGSATVSVMSRDLGASLSAVDVGVGRPTSDIRFEAAVTPERFDEIVDRAWSEVDQVVAARADVLLLGELGIGNTTIAAALSAALIGGASADWVGRGTGVDDDGLVRKIAAVEMAVRRVAGIDDPIELLRQVGGSEQIAIAAACVRARQHRIPVLLDGYVSTAAVLPLRQVTVTALDHCLAGHVSAEPGHRRLLTHLRLDPMLDLDLRLGEATGALAALPLLNLACVALTEVATFDEWFGNNPEGRP